MPALTSPNHTHANISLPYCGKFLPLPDSDRFSNWSELEAYLCEALDLEVASICLLPDFLASDTGGDPERRNVRRLDEHAVLVEASAGYRARIVAHLVRDREAGAGSEWPAPRELCQIASRAKEIYGRTVSDRVVDLMAGPRSGLNVAWLYLDEQGAVDSASVNAAEFCRLCSARQRREEKYLPASVEGYLKRLIADHSDGEKRFPEKGVAFAVSLERALVHSLVRRMAGDGFLLSLWRE